jgi:hypothetical protein
MIVLFLIVLQQGNGEVRKDGYRVAQVRQARNPATAKIIG